MHVYRRMTDAVVVVGRGDAVFRRGETWRFRSEAEVPPAIRANSEVIDADLAGEVTPFDSERFAAITAPKPEPKPEPAPLTRDDVLRLTGWSDEELRRAVTSLGFPRAGAYRTDGSPLWEEAAVRRYLEAAAGVPAPVKSAGLGAWLR